jgi:chemotaxis protein MotB
MAAEPSIIIVKKRRGGHGGHHGGAWKVAYADFVTAMMAFFLVMWLVGQSKSVKSAIGGYFRDPGVFDQQHSNGAIPGGNGGILPDGVPKTEPPAGDPAAAKQALEQAIGRIHAQLESLPDFEALRDHVEMNLTEEGLRIQLVDSNESNFFDSASATLKPEAVKMLKLIAAELAKQPNEIAIEGHTDSVPYGGGGASYTNWELSADRANAARRVMETELRPHQLAVVRGYADTQPRAGYEPSDPRNRRVSIVVRATGSETAARVIPIGK